jgi:hypothetical protein
VAGERDRWVGTVASVERRSDQVGAGQTTQVYQVLVFRLQQFSGSGDRRGLITVELRAQQLAGDVAPGDQVRAYGRLKDGIVRAKRVDNITTGGTLGPVKDRVRTVVQVAFAVLVILVAFLIIAGILGGAHPYGFLKP